MSESLNALDELLTAIENLPYLPLIFISCIVMGYLLKRWPKYPNAFIPFAVVFMGVLNTVLLSLPVPADQHWLPWGLRKCLVGLVVGFLAWAAHAQVLRRVTSRVPWLKGLDEPKEVPGKATGQPPPGKE